MRNTRIVIAAALATMLIAAGVSAQEPRTGASGSTSGQATGTAGAEAKPAGAAMSADTKVSTAGTARANVDVRELRRQVDERASKVPAKQIESAENRLETDSKDVESEARVRGDATVAARLAKQFGMTEAAILDEHQRLAAPWGELMIAHTLVANANTGVTVEQLLALERDGMGWGRIAAGLGFDLGSAMRAVGHESQVAAGRSAATGHVAVIHGEGARAGLDTHMGMSAGARGLGVRSNAAGGIKVGK